MNCKDCVNGILGTCQYSKNSAACLCAGKPWREEPKEKLLNYVDRMRKYDVAQFARRLEYLSKLEEEIKKL
jgi:hypothetical protein